MQRWDGIESVPDDLRASVVTIGNFDGVHRGHGAVLDAVVQAARAEDAMAVAVTFEPHPARVPRPQQVPELLTGLADRLELLAGHRLDAVLVIEYTLDFARLDPEEFVHQYLVQRLRAKRVVVGEDVRFGRDNAGDRDTMANLGQRYGFGVDLVHEVAAGGQRRWSSSWVRELLAAGDVRAAAEILDRPHWMRGTVVRGHARGRDLGFPTANLDAAATGAVPADGVYAGWLVRAPGTEAAERLPAAISIGTNPTFDGLIRQVEAHVLGRWDLELYEQDVRLEFVQMLRSTVRFDSIDALVRQMRTDVLQAAEVLRVPEPQQAPADAAHR